MLFETEFGQGFIQTSKYNISAFLSFSVCLCIHQSKPFMVALILIKKKCTVKFGRTRTSEGLFKRLLSKVQH